MELNKTHWIGVGISLAILGLSILLRDTRFFLLVSGTGILIGILPFILSVVREASIANEKEEMFIEFSRNLVESVKTGTPINKAIINVRNKAYGALSEHIKKLANQISVGIPLNKALQTFAKDIGNKTISRSIILIGQAEKSGGEISNILESVTETVSMVDRLKKERKSAISMLVVQGYIIFFVFIIIVLVLQFQIVPSLSGIAPASGEMGGALGLGIGSSGGGEAFEPEEITASFVYLLMAQGFFTGLVVGELSEGNFKVGLKHSFILMIIAFAISTGANVIFGG
ncbi:type II secretion system F family protein [Patescibacteria group bacterium]|nr:type II secretion system F family protein [Patescibacteria group bacterium]